MFFRRKSESLTLESLDARVREIEARLACADYPSAPHTRTLGRRTTGTLEAALRSYVERGGFTLPPVQPRD